MHLVLVWFEFALNLHVTYIPISETVILFKHTEITFFCYIFVKQVCVFLEYNFFKEEATYLNDKTKKNFVNQAFLQECCKFILFLDLHGHILFFKEVNFVNQEFS